MFWIFRKNKVYKITLGQFDTTPLQTFMYFTQTKTAWRAVRDANLFAAQKTQETGKKWGLIDMVRVD